MNRTASKTQGQESNGIGKLDRTLLALMLLLLSYVFGDTLIGNNKAAQAAQVANGVQNVEIAALHKKDDEQDRELQGLRAEMKDIHIELSEIGKAVATLSESTDKSSRNLAEKIGDLSKKFVDLQDMVITFMREARDK